VGVGTAVLIGHAISAAAAVDRQRNAAELLILVPAKIPWLHLPNRLRLICTTVKIDGIENGSVFRNVHKITKSENYILGSSFLDYCID
jgi:hypothetical protein